MISMIALVGMSTVFATPLERECAFYEAIVASRANVEKLETWADSVVFSRSFRVEEVGTGRLVGPGRRAIRVGVIKDIPDVDLTYIGSDYEIRLIGSPDEPQGVFLGERSFSGVIVARESPGVSFEKVGFSLGDRLIRGRVVSVCRPD